MQEHAVVIAGGGPTGLMLAAELRLAGTDALIVERRLSQELDGSRAGGLHSRTLEVLEQRGVVERFLTEGQVVQANGFGGIHLDISDFPSRHPYSLALYQREIERIMAEWVLDDLGAPILRGHEVVGFGQDADVVDVELDDGQKIRAQYLVGCDGGRSVVRKAAAIEFPGLDPSISYILAEVEMTGQPPIGVRPEGGGIGPRIRDGRTTGPYGVVLTERGTEHATEPTMDDLREVLVEKFGTDFGVHSPTWITRFTDMSRQAAAYRERRVLLAGDAAHVHPPQGGQGLNLGVQDAVNLGWKLARVVAGTSPDAVLDTYHDERHPVGARVLHNTEAQVALVRPDDRQASLRDIVGDLLGLDEARRKVGGMMSGLDIRYGSDESHPLIGCRMPDLDLDTANGTTRVSTLLHEAQPVLLNLGGAPAPDADAAGVRVVDATTDGPWQLPVVGAVPALAAVLIRPDGHVAWAGDPDDPELSTALATWFGSPTAAPTN